MNQSPSLRPIAILACILLLCIIAMLLAGPQLAPFVERLNLPLK